MVANIRMRAWEMEADQALIQTTLQEKLSVEQLQDFCKEDLDILARNGFLAARHFETATETLLLAALPGRTALVRILMKAFKPVVVQRGSLDNGQLYVAVNMVHQGVQLTGTLLVDSGCNVDLNLSEYKAEQLGLLPDSAPVGVELAQMAVGQLQRRGVIFVHVQVEVALGVVGVVGVVSDDLDRSTWLEVWTDVGSNRTSPVRAPMTPAASPSPSPRPSSSQGWDSGGYCVQR